MMTNKEGEQLVWLVWELVGGKVTLAVICTTNKDLARYVTSNREEWIRGGPVFCEKVLTNHLYGANDSIIAARVMRRSGQ